MIFESLSGTRYDLSKYGLIRLFHYIPRAEITHTSSFVEGKGEVITSTTINQRTITVNFGFKVRDIYDYYLLRDELNALFSRKEEFYIIFKREAYKRWKVKVIGEFQLPPKPKMGDFTVEFRTVDKYAESTGTSLQLVERSIDSGLWGYGSGINVDEEYQYEFTTSEFTVHNIGTVELDPCEWPLEIEIQAIASSYLQIQNLTNGDIYRFNESLVASDILRISGIRTFKNNVSKYGSTNKKNIRLVPGANRIRITGGTVNRAAFNFKFPYL